MSAAFHRIPTLRSYAQAFDHFSKSVPIRGRAPELRPLANSQLGRKDADRFHIRAVANPLQPSSNPSIQCVLYKTPVVTFHPDNTVTITTGVHYAPSISTAKFINMVLRDHLHVSHTGRRLLVTARDNTGTRYKRAIAARQAMDFYIDEHTCALTPVDPTPQQSVVIDRAKANIVRARYGAFYRYLKASISLLREPPTMNQISVSIAEMAKVLPLRDIEHKLLSPHVYFDVANAQQMTQKPAINSIHYRDWVNRVENFLPLIEPTASPADYYKAFMLLCFWSNPAPQLMINPTKLDTIVRIYPPHITSLIDEIIFKYHSKEVFTTRDVSPEQVPGVKYLRWVDWREETVL